MVNLSNIATVHRYGDQIRSDQIDSDRSGDLRRGMAMEVSSNGLNRSELIGVPKEENTRSYGNMGIKG